MGGYSVSFRNAKGNLVCRNYDVTSFFFPGIYSPKEMANKVKELLEAKGFTEVTVRDRESKMQSYNSYTTVSRKSRENAAWKERLKI